MTGGLDRALPQPMVDLIRDGAHPVDLRRDGQRAVWSALFRTAASAVQRGWDRWEWEALVQEPSSTLGRQASTRDGQRPRTAAATAKTLGAAWDRATIWTSEQPARWTRAEAVEQALRRADLVTELAADPAADLPDAQRAVLAYAAGQARARRIDRVPLPRRDVMAATGLGVTALRTALVRLDAGELLVLAERGKPAPPSASPGRASLYRLAREDHPALAAYLYRETRSVVPPAQVCGAPADDDRPTPTSDAAQEAAVVTVTISAPDPETLAATLRAMQAGGVTVEQSVEPPAELGGNVVPIRHRANA